MSNSYLCKKNPNAKFVFLIREIKETKRTITSQPIAYYTYLVCATKGSFDFREFSLIVLLPTPKTRRECRVLWSVRPCKSPFISEFTKNNAQFMVITNNSVSS